MADPQAAAPSDLAAGVRVAVLDKLKEGGAGARHVSVWIRDYAVLQQQLAALDDRKAPRYSALLRQLAPADGATAADAAADEGGDDTDQQVALAELDELLLEVGHALDKDQLPEEANVTGLVSILSVYGAATPLVAPAPNHDGGGDDDGGASAAGAARQPSATTASMRKPLPPLPPRATVSSPLGRPPSMAPPAPPPGVSSRPADSSYLYSPAPLVTETSGGGSSGGGGGSSGGGGGTGGSDSQPQLPKIFFAAAAEKAKVDPSATRENETKEIISLAKANSAPAFDYEAIRSLLITNTLQITSQSEKNFTAYAIKLTDNSSTATTIVRRYRDFETLYTKIEKAYAKGLIMDFPKKSLFKNMDADVINKRKTQLNSFMSQVIVLEGIWNLDAMHVFLHGDMRKDKMHPGTLFKRAKALAS